MSTKATEIQIREQTKSVLKFLEDGQTEEAKQLILSNKEILRYNFGLINFVPLIPRIRFSKIIPKNHDALKMVMETGFEIFDKEGKINELIFFAAAKCNTEKLQYCVDKITEQSPNGMNRVREGDTVLMFLIKYGNIADDNYPECMKILIDSGVDVNRNDYFSHSPIGFLGDLYNRYRNRTKKDDGVIRNLRRCINMLLDTKLIDLSSLKVKSTPMTPIDLLKEHHFFNLDYSGKENVEEEKDKLFKYLLNNEEEAFVKSVSGVKSEEGLRLLDVDDGNNTLLQLCCEKNLEKSAKFLIEKGADLSKTTERNQKTPLELAARRNHPEIFNALLNTDRIVIDEPLFLTFLRGRPKHIKAKYFDEILKYKNLDVTIRSSNGNTPLHYAIIFSSAEAIQVLLRRGASLTVENDSKKCPLDYISAEELENYLNKCMVPDTYNDINNGKYEVALNYRNLIEVADSNVSSELTIVEKICDSPKLSHLLHHPLISSFINIKWKLVEPIYQKFFIFHVMFYVISILSFINLNLLNYLGLPLALIYGVRIWSTFNWNKNKLHETVDIVIAVILFLTVLVSNNVVKYQLGLIATIFMALSLHLFWRFSPNFSQFHALLMSIFSQLVTCLFYIFSLVLFFGAAFHIFYLVKDENLNDNYSNAFFNHFQIMPSYFYLLCVFGLFVSVMIVMTLINSVTFLQDNVEHIKNNFRVLGYRNILLFLRSMEELYLAQGLIKNPCIFDELYLKDKDDKVKPDEGISKKKLKKANKSKNKYIINFYINTNKFSNEKLLSIKLAHNNVLGIKNAIIR